MLKFAKLNNIYDYYRALKRSNRTDWRISPMSKIILKGLAVALAGLSVILGAGAQVPLEF